MEIEDSIVRVAFKKKVESNCNNSEDRIKLKTSFLDVACEACSQTNG